MSERARLRRAAARAVVPGWTGLLPALALAALFLVPFAIMLGVSVAERDPGGFYKSGFDPGHYARFFSPFFGGILLVSVMFSAGAAAIAIALATPFTLALAAMTRRAQTVILVALLAMLSLSEVIIGFAMSVLLSRSEGLGAALAALGLTAEPLAFVPGAGGLIAGLVYLGFPYAVLTLYPAISRLDPAMTEAARSMGATPLRAFIDVTLPTLRAPLLGAGALVFVFTLGSYLLPQLLGRPQHWTLSVHITDQAVFQSNLPFAAAMAVFLLVVALALTGLTARLAGRAR